MTAPLYRLGHFCTRHRHAVLIVWLVVVVAIAVLARTAGQETNDNLSLPGTDSQKATDLLDAEFPSQANGTNPVAFRAPAGAKLTDAKYKNVIQQVTQLYAKNPLVRQAISPFSSAGADQINKAKTIGYISLNVKDNPSELTTDDAQDLVDIADPLQAAGLETGVGGYVGIKVSKASTHVSEVVGLLAAVIILLLTFGTAVAMSVPITTAILGLIAGMGLITLLGHVVQVPTTAPALATMIGLGVGIDYGLFMVTRHRRQLADGMECNESIARASATAGGAVVFAGGTVMIALLSLYAASIPLVTTLGYTSALVVLIAVIAAITLIPAILAMLGERINHLKLPWLKTHEQDRRPHGWARWAQMVAGHPWPSLAIGVIVMVILALPILDLTLGQQDNGALPKDTQTRQSYDLMSAGFGAGSNGPILVTIHLSKPAQNDQAQLNKLEQQEKAQEAQGQTPSAKEKQQQQFLSTTASDPRLTSLQSDIAKTPDVDSVTFPLVNKDGTAAIYNVFSTSSPSSDKTTDLVNNLRDNVIPAGTKGKQMSGEVGGSTSGYIDLATKIADKLPLVIGIVLILSFFVLLLAFRSLLVPLKAVLMNILSILAAFGVVTYVFSHDWSAQLIGLQGPVPIVSFVPLMMFAILFGLSMDYEVFLMTHVREDYTQSHDPHEAIVDGLAVTARVITSAALIMVSVFLAFVLNGNPTVKQFGLGMAAAVAVDATIVRCLIVPAIMSLLGKAGWWLPNWLDRATPEISIEGREFFEEADKKAAAEAAKAAPVGGGPWS